jgi:predicted outer membrane protein
MTLTVSIGVVGLVLSVVPVWAADFSAELDFVTRASNANLFAVEESRLALDRSSDSQVKTFAGQMVEDHKRAEAELLTAAEGSGAAVPTALDEEHQARLTTLQGKSGADFARATSPIRAKTTPMLSPSMLTTCSGVSMRNSTPWQSQ